MTYLHTNTAACLLDEIRSSTLLDSASAKHDEVAKEILRLRQSTDNVGALIESSWSEIQTKTTRKRLMFGGDLAEQIQS